MTRTIETIKKELKGVCAAIYSLECEEGLGMTGELLTLEAEAEALEAELEAAKARG